MERIAKGNDIIKMANDGDLAYFFERPVYEKDALFFKSSKIPLDNKYLILAGYLREVASIIERIEDGLFSKETIKEKLWPYAEEVGRGPDSER